MLVRNDGPGEIIVVGRYLGPGESRKLTPRQLQAFRAEHPHPDWLVEVQQDAPESLTAAGFAAHRAGEPLPPGLIILPPVQIDLGQIALPPGGSVDVEIPVEIEVVIDGDQEPVVTVSVIDDAPVVEPAVPAAVPAPEPSAPASRRGGPKRP